MMMFHIPLFVWIAAATAGALLFALVLGTVVIGEQESGLVSADYGRALPPGRMIATRGEAGLPGRAAAAGLALPAVALEVQGPEGPADRGAAGPDRTRRREGRHRDPGGARARQGARVRQLPGRGALPRRTAARKAASSRS